MLSILFTNQHWLFRKNAEIALKRHFPRFSREQIEDIVSDAFAAIWKQGLNVTLSCTPQTYLHTICRNKAIDFTRKEKTRQFSLERYMSATEENDFQKERLEIVANAVTHLPSPRKRALMETLYDVKIFDAETPSALKIAYRNDLKNEAVQKRLGYPSAIALRQEKHRIITALREALVTTPTSARF